MTDEVGVARRVTGAGGLLAALLFGVGNALWAFDQPSLGASVGHILAFYRADANWIIAGASISLISFVPFTMFASGLRILLRQEDPVGVFAPAAFAGAVLLVGVGLGAETINLIGALRAGTHNLTPGLGLSVFEISYVLGYTAAGIGAGILLLAVAAVGFQRKPMTARATAAFLLVLGCCFLTPLSRYLLAPAVVLLAVASVRFLIAKDPNVTSRSSRVRL